MIVVRISRQAAAVVPHQAEITYQQCGNDGIGRREYRL
jgi:hypothetical protein